MEGWVSPGTRCKEQMAHGCYATARGRRWTRTHNLAISNTVMCYLFELWHSCGARLRRFFFTTSSWLRSSWCWLKGFSCCFTSNSSSTLDAGAKQPPWSLPLGVSCSSVLLVLMLRLWCKGEGLRNCPGNSRNIHIKLILWKTCPLATLLLLIVEVCFHEFPHSSLRKVYTH